MTDLHGRAAALLAAADRMTRGHWIAVATMSRRHAASIAYENRRGAEFIMVCGGPGDTDRERDQRDEDAEGIVALRNEAPALIRELLAENERPSKAMCDLASDNERLRARVAELEAATKRVGFQFPQLDATGRCFACGKHHGNLPCPMTAATSAVDPNIAPQPYSTADAGPTPYRGRTTRRE